ncbi:hypothetical protein Pmar_PMAR020743 [Perkinsus marinus ATCC 50983]|uniref:Uncharacterized protein n=1 Tax=Perkinsus marinus (strain ATCC 50983 / TXsc) TaxID=423536 RepID=C5KQQ7_PERM5|nr:hypothetical protein Pmar_PMAR020743 [Perkinsus marinus ATCC 50983]EER13153.1 hypothetical protein Pmar_PMAR020743 [Perkinsus marinus ATCC 50983]|eukprot:XP_002781358.1 hypothetical protein Pmar_PMAR020743 [Perkinsus marinus ATCC 50983]
MHRNQVGLQVPAPGKELLALPDTAYHLFAGKDVTRAFALMSFKPEDIENSRSTEGFEDANWQALQEWVDKYERYDKVGVLLYPDERSSEGSLDRIAGVSTETQCDVDAEDSAETIGTAQPVLSGTVRKTLKIHRRKVGHVETSAAENARRALQETGISEGGMLRPGSEAKDSGNE